MLLDRREWPPGTVHVDWHPFFVIYSLDARVRDSARKFFGSQASCLTRTTGFQPVVYRRAGRSPAEIIQRIIFQRIPPEDTHAIGTPAGHPERREGSHTSCSPMQCNSDAPSFDCEIPRRLRDSG